MKTLSQGLFIVIDGTDGSGKATTTKLLKEKLVNEGYDVESISFPQYGSKSAGPVELYLKGDIAPLEEFDPYQASAFYAVDRSFARFKINEWLDAGKVVISDRYVAANAGHQGGKISDPNERARFLDWLYDFEYERLKVVRPDINIILYCPFEIAQKRKLAQTQNPDIHERDTEHLKNAAASYLWLAQEKAGEFILIETCSVGRELSKEEVTDRVWQILYPFIKSLHRN